MKFFESRYLFLLFLIAVVLVTYSTVFTSARLPGGDMSDTESQGYPFFTFTLESIRNGQLPHWNPYIFCGIPFYSSFSAPVFYPVRGILLLAAGVEGMVRFLFPIQMFMGGVFAWLFLGSIGTGRWGRIVGSIAFATTAWSNTLFYAGHGSKIICWSFLPLLLYACEKWLQTRRGRYVAIGGLSLGMQMLASHPQMVLYSGIAMLVWMLLRSFSGWKPKGARAASAFSGLILMVVLGLAVGAVQMLPGYNFSQYSTRGTDLSLDQAQSYSLPPEETLTMIFPHLFGYRHGFPDSTVSGAPTYFGRLGLRLSSEFTGVIVFLLAVWAFIRYRRKYGWPLLVIACLGLLISWGGYTPFFGLLYRIVPFIRKLRAPHMAAFLTTSAIALAAGPGFDALFRREDEGSGRFMKAVMIFSGLCLLVFLLAGPLLTGLQSSWWRRMGNPQASGFQLLVNRRVDMASADFIKAAVISGLLAGLLYYRKLWIGRIAIPGSILAALIAIETVPVDRDFQYFLHQTSVRQLFPQDDDLAEMTGEGRLLPGGNQYIPLHIMSVAGYHAAKPSVTEDMQTVLSSGGPLAYRSTAFNVIQTQSGNVDYSGFRQMFIQQASQARPTYADTLESILPEQPLPRVWFAASWTELSRESCLDLLRNGLDPQNVTVLYQEPELPEHLETSGSSAEITVDQPCRVVIDTENENEGLLVLADTWYPRWKVSIDGASSEMLQANNWQRAVVVPAGEHEVEFDFDSSDVSTGLLISVIGLFSCLIISLLDIIISRRKGTGTA